MRLQTAKRIQTISFGISALLIVLLSFFVPDEPSFCLDAILTFSGYFIVCVFTARLAKEGETDHFNSAVFLSTFCVGCFVVILPIVHLKLGYGAIRSVDLVFYITWLSSDKIAEFVERIRKANDKRRKNPVEEEKAEEPTKAEQGAEKTL